MQRPLAAAAIATLGFLGCSASAGATECTPHCDYIQDYGPYDYTYVRPRLFGYPVCDWRGNCLPYYAYGYSGWPSGRITVRSLRRQ